MVDDHDLTVPTDETQNCRLTADQGDAVAQFNLGVKYANGQGVPQDDEEAARRYRLAAEQGHVEAQFKLGWRYENGLGVPQDDQEAIFQKVQRNECPNRWV